MARTRSHWGEIIEIEQKDKQERERGKDRDFLSSMDAAKRGKRKKRAKTGHMKTHIFPIFLAAQKRAFSSDIFSLSLWQHK